MRLIDGDMAIEILSSGEESTATISKTAARLVPSVAAAYDWIGRLTASVYLASGSRTDQFHITNLTQTPTPAKWEQRE